MSFCFVFLNKLLFLTFLTWRIKTDHTSRNFRDTAIFCQNWLLAKVNFREKKKNLPKFSELDRIFFSRYFRCNNIAIDSFLLKIKRNKKISNKIILKNTLKILVIHKSLLSRKFFKRFSRESFFLYKSTAKLLL